MAQNPEITYARTKGLLPSGQIYGNTFYIAGDSLAGTSFSVDYKGEHYLVTAKHLFKTPIWRFS